MEDLTSSIPTALIPPQPTATTVLTARELAASALYPNIKTTAQASVVIAKAKTFGVCPTTIAENLQFIKGKPGMSGLLMAALVKRNGFNFRIKKKTATECVIDFFEKSIDGKKWELVGTETVTLDMAKQAGWTSSPTYKTMPATMLMWRCFTAGIRSHLPQALLGMPAYTPDELDSSIEIDENGEVIDSTFTPSAPPDDNNYRELLKLLKQTNTPTEKLLALFKVSTLKDLTSGQTAHAVTLLTAKLEAKTV